jgi:hypothetical protein
LSKPDCSESGIRAGFVRCKTNGSRARKRFRAFGWIEFEAKSLSLKEEGGTMLRELELIAISLVFVFLGAIIVGVIH